jgi:aryl-alcohol dehydrogenase-like predicted oxidoreductase
MNYKPLGRTGVQVSQLCFGTMPFGGDADEAASAEMFKAVRDLGVNFFDTADQYSKGKSEEILGRLMRGTRDDLVVATKCFNASGPDINAKGSSRRHVTRAVEASLKRLQTDRVDILYLHMRDALTPIDETMRALEDVVRDYILAALEKNDGNQTHTAQQLKIGSATLYRKLKRYGRINDRTAN